MFGAATPPMRYRWPGAIALLSVGVCEEPLSATDLWRAIGLRSCRAKCSPSLGSGPHNSLIAPIVHISQTPTSCRGELWISSTPQTQVGQPSGAPNGDFPKPRSKSSAMTALRRWRRCAALHMRRAMPANALKSCCSIRRSKEESTAIAMANEAGYDRLPSHLSC
jgi:hypothetical protein